MQPAWAVIRVSISGSEMVEIDKYHDSFFTIVPGGCVFERDGGAPLPDPAPGNDFPPHWTPRISSNTSLGNLQCP